MIDWEGILERDGNAAWKAAWRVLGNQADSDECFQEACLDALEYSRSHKVMNWKSLLQRLATARAIDRLRQRIRRRGREDALPEELIPAAGPIPPEQLENLELAANLRSALAELPSRMAEVFCLFHLNGWSYSEIAESQAISIDLVGVWLQRARARLSRLLTGVTDSNDEVIP